MNEIFDDLIKEIADNCVKSFNDKSKSLLPSEEKIVEKLKYMGIISKKDEDNHLSLTAGSVSYALNESFEIGRDKLKILVIPQDKARVIASQIYETLQKDEREYNSKNGIDYFDYELDDEDEENYENKQIELITNLLKKEYEKYTPIEVNRGNEDERLKFNFAISNITKNLKMLNFDKEKVEENIGVDINFLKQGEREKYLIEVSNGNKNLKILSNNLPDLKDKLVELLEKNIEDTKEFYENNYREDFGENRQKRLEILKKMDIKDLEIGTKANIQFEYEENTLDNRILELNSDDENEYKGNIEDFIKGYKENIKSDFFNELGEKKEEFLLNKEKIFGDYVRDGEDIKNAYNQAILDLSYKYNHNHFYDYQEKIIQNQISLSVDEKIKEYYYDGNKYVSKILEDSKDLSETVSFDEKTFYKELRKFDTSPYEKFSDDRIEITKEKEEIKEKDKTKEKEIEL